LASGPPVLVNWGRCGEDGAWREWENAVDAVVSVLGAIFGIWPIGAEEKRFPNRRILVKVKE
jgi:hypothetical protein